MCLQISRECTEKSAQVQHFVFNAFSTAENRIRRYTATSSNPNNDHLHTCTPSRRHWPATGSGREYFNLSR